MNPKKILLTGSSSFTGYWFAKELSNFGFKVCCPLPRNFDEYSGVKKLRLAALKDNVELVFNCPFGSEKFIGLCENHFDYVGFHGFYMEEYGNNHYKISTSLSQCLKNIEAILKILKVNCRGIIYSSSIFEDAINLEGDHNESYSLPWYNYAFSKKVTYIALRSLCVQNDIFFQRFVITNPFGPYEDYKFCYHLMNSILDGKDFSIKTPYYTRDMIQIDVLAKQYLSFFTDMNAYNSTEIRPHQYTMEIYKFAELFNSKISKFCGNNINIINEKQENYIEPKTLVNNTVKTSFVEDKNYKFWEEYYLYYFSKKGNNEYYNS